MNIEQDGGPAFPVPNDANVNGQMGMSLRDYFAAKAMQGLLFTGEDRRSGQTDLAVQAYSMADIMIQVRSTK
jgi:hypothetical protein